MFYAIDLPWGFTRPAGLSYDSKLKINFYEGQPSASILSLRAREFSRERWFEDEKNRLKGRVELNKLLFTPKPHQIEAAKKIARSYEEGWSGFLLADKTGVGKTLSALSGLALIAKRRGNTPQKLAKVLIVCPKAVIPQWRQTIKSYQGSLFLRPLIINYQQLQKLLKPLPVVKKNKTKRGQKRQLVREGEPIIDFDFVIFDEAHKLKNYPSSNTSLAAVSVAKLDKTYKSGTSPFVIFSTATPGSTPLNFAVMAGFMAPLLGSKRFISPGGWGDFLMKNGFAITKGKSGYSWAPLPWGVKDERDPGVRVAKEKQRKDSQRIGRALIKKDAPFIMRSPKDIAGWPEQQLIGFPLELTAKERAIYLEAWTAFRTWLHLTPARSDPKGALVQQLRYRQKTSLLRVSHYEELVKDWVDEGKQVYMSFEFVESVEKMKEILKGLHIPYAQITGSTPADQKEKERLKFQTGTAKVVLCSVLEGISLHQEEILPNGKLASSAERITVLADIRQNPLDSQQALGRAHRDGKNSLAYIPYIEDSVDRKVVDSLINKLINMAIMTGKRREDAEELETVFRTAAEEDK